MNKIIKCLQAIGIGFAITIAILGGFLMVYAIGDKVACGKKITLFEVFFFAVGVIGLLCFIGLGVNTVRDWISSKIKKT